jgi:8-oxo-dGTP pyrophosphatase MutT (NUDIX family)
MRRSLTLGVRGVVVDQSGKVLLLRHTYTPGWHFPGGGVEKGETAARSMIRELKEEAGIEAAEKDLQLLSIHANHAFFPNDHVLLFRVNTWRQGEPTSRGEIAEIRFVDPLAPPAGVSKGTNHRLQELFGGQAVSELW